MFDGQFVFTQVLDFLPRRDFNACVERYRGNYKCRGFSCRDQFLVMAFGVLPASLQFLNRDSPGDESRLRGRSDCRRWAVQRARGGHVESAGGCTIESITIVPGHPLPWSGGDGSSMPLQRGQVLERIAAA